MHPKKFWPVFVALSGKLALDLRQVDPGTKVSETLDVKLFLEQQFCMTLDGFRTMEVMERCFQETLDVQLALERRF